MVAHNERVFANMRALTYALFQDIWWLMPWRLDQIIIEVKRK